MKIKKTTHNFEYEERAMLSSDEYESLMKYYQNLEGAKYFSQVNHYFDSKDFILKNNMILLRARIIEENIYELTLKTKEDKGTLETNKIITYKKFMKLRDCSKVPSKEIRRRIKKVMSIKNLKYIGQLKTERLEYKENDYLIVIDKNYYGDVIDFNIEIEAQSKKEAKKILESVSKKFSIKVSDNYMSKSKRLFHYLSLIS